MNPQMTRRLLTGFSLAAALALVVACSAPSSSLSPTSPTAAVGASAQSAVNFSPNPVVTCTPPEVLNPVTNQCEPPTETLTGRFTGGGFQIGEVKVTRGFTIHCDNLLTNNLEVNWGGGNNFHMAKNSLVSVVCTRPDDPTPPAAPVSRISASSSGTCNGLPANISFILEDHGEPGSDDRAQLIISGGCSLNLPLALLDGGNIQAHFDQPHKK